MTERYKIIELHNDEFVFKYRFAVLGFQGMKADGKPIYTLLKQFRNEKRANEYINKALTEKGQTRLI